MQMMDNVQIIVEKERYVREGVHKGMYGWICLDDCVNGYWLVNFPQCGEKDDIAEISIREEDMKVVKILYAEVNEQIKAQFDERGNPDKKSFDDKHDDLSNYLV